MRKIWGQNIGFGGPLFLALLHLHTHTYNKINCDKSDVRQLSGSIIKNNKNNKIMYVCLYFSKVKIYKIL